MNNLKQRIENGRPTPLNFKDKVVYKLRHMKTCLLNVKFDKQTGMYVYPLYGREIFIKYRWDIVFTLEHLWKCHEIYFKNYQPQANDVILDFGAGYGEEAAFLSSLQNDLTYIGFEILPSVYECISNTLGTLSNGNYRCSPFAVTPHEDKLLLSSQYKYSSIGNTEQKGAVEVFSKTWAQMKTLYQFDKIDLVKMNIEGSETMVLDCIDDFSTIKRFAIECHDFRADRGHGEFYRTKAKVIEKLQKEGYDVTENYLGVAGYEWADGWVHAVRKSV